MKMSDKYAELFRMLIEVSKIEQLKATTHDTSRGGLMTGAATVIIGLVLGIYGLIIGIIIGAAASAALARDFRPVWILVRDLTHEQKEALLGRMLETFKKLGISNVANAPTVLLTDMTLRYVAIDIISKFFNDELQLRVL